MVAYEDVINPETGELFVGKDEVITKEVATEIQNSGINVVDVKYEDKKVRIIGNGTVDIKAYVSEDVLKNVKAKQIKELVNYEVLKNILENTDEKDLAKVIEERIDELVPKHVTTEDILSSIKDTYATIISNNLNIAMKFLASMTIVLSIPTIISSLLGMNVP